VYTLSDGSNLAVLASPFTIFSWLIRLKGRRESPLGAQPSDAGEALSVETAFKKERGRLLGFIRRRIDNPSEAEDLLQEVFYQLLASDGVTGPIENLVAWLYTVARNKVTDWYRKRRAARPPQGTGDKEGSLDRSFSGPADDPAYAFWRSLFWSELGDALEELPEEQRNVFVAHELEGLTFKEIAERTGEPINTLLSRKRYAVLFLRERLQEVYAELDVARKDGS